MNKHYHFIGIGGIGMGALASLLLDKGYRVSGSDVSENQMVKSLKTKGAIIALGHKKENVGKADYVVFSSAVGDQNPERQCAVEQKIPILKRAELLAQLMREHVGITIAGAHGKTTTTAMTSHLLQEAGFKPTTAVGGIINEALTNATLGQGKYFVAEVDESDGSFLNFHPDYSIITNVDLEHVDYYKDWDELLSTYRQFIRQTKQGGLLIGCGDDVRLLDLLKADGHSYITYGLSPHNDFIAKNIKFKSFGSQFDCFFHGQLLGTVILNVPGQHNILNSLAVIALSHKLAIDFSLTRDILSRYKGVQRRFQVIGKIKDMYVIDDYAHHPTEITATLTAARHQAPSRLVAIFQPHRYSRFVAFAPDFIKSLKSADYVIVTDVYAASEQPIPEANVVHFTEQLKIINRQSAIYLPKEKIGEYLRGFVEPNDFIVTLGAGDISQIAKNFVASFEGVVECQSK